jgi:hypothetical protein
VAFQVTRSLQGCLLFSPCLPHVFSNRQDLPDCATDCFSPEGLFTGSVMRWLSDMRTTHGKDAVIIKGCGRFELAEDLSDIADMTHIDLSGIDTLEGG